MYTHSQTHKIHISMWSENLFADDIPADIFQTCEVFSAPHPPTFDIHTLTHTHTQPHTDAQKPATTWHTFLQSTQPNASFEGSARRREAWGEEQGGTSATACCSNPSRIITLTPPWTHTHTHGHRVTCYHTYIHMLTHTHTHTHIQHTQHEPDLTPNHKLNMVTVRAWSINTTQLLHCLTPPTHSTWTVTFYVSVAVKITINDHGA